MHWEKRKRGQKSWIWSLESLDSQSPCYLTLDHARVRCCYCLWMADKCKHNIFRRKVNFKIVSVAFFFLLDDLLKISLRICQLVIGNRQNIFCFFLLIKYQNQSTCRLRAKFYSFCLAIIEIASCKGTLSKWLGSIWGTLVR